MMDDRNPLAPASNYGKSDDEVFVNFRPHTPKNHNKPPNKCFVYVLLILVLCSIAFLIYGLAVLRINAPSVRLSSVSVSNLNLLNDTSSLNMTMVAEVSVRNRNFGPFRFVGGVVTFVYENTTIGTGSFLDGSVAKRGRMDINVNVGVSSPGTYNFTAINSTTNFTRDVGTGLINLRSFAQLRGRVRAMKMLTRHRDAIMNCSMALDLTSRNIHNLLCQ